MPAVSWVSIGLMPIQIRIVPYVLHMLKNQNFCYIHSSASLHVRYMSTCCIFLVSVVDVIIFNILDSTVYCNFLGKTIVQLYCNFGWNGYPPDPDGQALDAEVGTDTCK